MDSGPISVIFIIFVFVFLCVLSNGIALAVGKSKPVSGPHLGYSRYLCRPPLYPQITSNNRLCQTVSATDSNHFLLNLSNSDIFDPEAVFPPTVLFGEIDALILGSYTLYPELCHWVSLVICYFWSFLPGCWLLIVREGIGRPSSSLLGSSH